MPLPAATYITAVGRSSAPQRRLWDRIRLVAEPAGATPLAALVSGAFVPATNERIGLVLSGGNTNLVRFDSA